MEPRRIWQNSDHLSWDGLSQDSIVLTYCHLPETCDLWNQEESGRTLITSVAKKNDGHGKGYPVSQSTNLGRWSVCARLWHVCYSLWPESTVTSHRSFDHTRLPDLHKNRSWTYVFLLVSPDLVIKIRVWGVADIGHLVRVIANLVINKYYRHLNLKTEYRKSTSQSSHFPKQNGSLDLFGPINIRVLSPVYSHEHSGSFFHNYLTIMSEKEIPLASHDMKDGQPTPPSLADPSPRPKWRATALWKLRMQRNWSGWAGPTLGQIWKQWKVKSSNGDESLGLAL